MYQFGLTLFNVLDHFIVSGRLFVIALSKLNVSHDMDNTGDHEPLSVQFDIRANRFSTSVRLTSVSS